MILNARTASMPGPYRSDFTPYAKGPMDAFGDPDIEHIILMFGAQTSKTQIFINILGYIIDQDPGPTMLVYPEEGTAEFVSLERLQPMFEDVECVGAKFRQRESERLELRFEDMFLSLVGANSPSKLASRPIRYLLRDEVAKYKKWTGDEASPLKLTEERTKTFPHSRKILDASTPKLKGDHIDKEYQAAAVRYHYYVPCPHCGHRQQFIFGTKDIPGGIKWPASINDDPDLALDEAWYECAKCHGKIEDRHKLAMLRAGDWAPDKIIKRARSVAFHLNSIYSPFVTFGQVAREFLRSKNDPADLMNFINSWLAEVWDDGAIRMNSDIVMARQGDEKTPRDFRWLIGEVPTWAQFLTFGCDVQKDHFWWVVRAFGHKMTSGLVANGRAEDWDEIERLINNWWGEGLQVNLACIDSGYNTDEVYEFCTYNQQVALPTKGASEQLRAPYIVSTIDKGIAEGLKLYVFDGDQYKSTIAGRMNKPNGLGSWMVYQGIDRLYCDQICSEQKAPIKNARGRIRETWQKIASHVANHYLDAEVNAMVAADILSWRFLSAPPPPEPSQPEPADNGNKTAWLRKPSWTRR